MNKKVRNYLKENWKDIVRTSAYYSAGMIVGYYLYKSDTTMISIVKHMIRTGDSILCVLSDGDYILSITKI